MTARTPAVLLGLDAADLGLIQRLGASGSLPNLSRLLERGCTGVIRGEAERFAGGVWPTFYTGPRPTGALSLRSGSGCAAAAAASRWWTCR
jgi:predicted AlkP superfamily phosphohydrolase/phosphomutase